MCLSSLRPIQKFADWHTPRRLLQPNLVSLQAIRREHRRRIFIHCFWIVPDDVSSTYKVLLGLDSYLQGYYRWWEFLYCCCRSSSLTTPRENVGGSFKLSTETWVEILNPCLIFTSFAFSGNTYAYYQRLNLSISVHLQVKRECLQRYCSSYDQLGKDYLSYHFPPCSPLLFLFLGVVHLGVGHFGNDIQRSVLFPGCAFTFGPDFPSLDGLDATSYVQTSSPDEN